MNEMFRKDQRVVVMRGIPGSGKSTWAKHFLVDLQGFKRVNMDDLRTMLTNYKFSKGNEKIVKHLAKLLVVTLVGMGEDVVIDNTSITVKHVDDWQELVESLNPNIRVAVREFDTALETCISRNRCREGVARIPEHVIEDFHRRWTEALATEQRDKYAQCPEPPL